MELIFKTAAAAATASVLSLLLRRRNPELALLLGVCAATVILLTAARSLGGLLELEQSVRIVSGLAGRYTLPILKCVAIALVSRFAADICRDSAQSAAASAVELAGGVCAVGVSMPLILSMLNMIGGLV